MGEQILSEYEEGKLEYQKDSVLLVVEDVNNSMLITHTKMDAEDVFQLTIYMIGKLAEYTGQDYNSVVEDLKEKEGEK